MSTGKSSHSFLVQEMFDDAAREGRAFRIRRAIAAAGKGIGDAVLFFGVLCWAIVGAYFAWDRFVPVPPYALAVTSTDRAGVVRVVVMSRHATAADCIAARNALPKGERWATDCQTEEVR